MKFDLTEKEVKNAKPIVAGKSRKMSDGGGLFLFVSGAGSKLWRYKYRLGGKEHLYSLGAYPSLTLAEARAEHLKARDLVASGTHPRQHRQLQKLQKLHDGADTFAGVADEWIKAKTPHWSPYYLSQVRRAMDCDIFPAIGALPVRKVTSAHVLAILKDVEARGAEVVAGFIRMWVSQVFRFAIANLRCDSDPAAPLRGVVIRPKVRHNLALTEPQIGELLTKLDEHGGTRSTRIAIELLLLLFVRTVELRKAVWSEFDLDAAVWKIPAERMKMRVEHRVPLSKQALKLLLELRQITADAPALFPNIRDADRFMSATTINRALERMGLAGKGSVGFSAHGFRGTASTLLHGRGYNSAVVERQLAHAEGNKVLAAYNQATYWPERVKLMQEWADSLDKLRVS
jgi:integrase